MILIEVPHYGSEATVSMISELNQTALDESWGFRNIHAYVRTIPGDIVTSGLTDYAFSD
jgi:hypothetical protein